MRSLPNYPGMELRTKKQIKRDQRRRDKEARRRARQDREWRKKRDTAPVVIKDRDDIISRPSHMGMVEMAAFAIVAAAIRKDQR